MARGIWASQVVLAVKNPPVNAGDIRDTGSIPGLGRSPGGSYGNPLQYSCLEHPMNRGAWWAAVQRVAESDTTKVTEHAHMHTLLINNVVTISGGQQRNSAVCIHVSILPQTPLPSRLLHNIEQSSLCYTVGPCWLFIFKYETACFMPVFLLV